MTKQILRVTFYHQEELEIKYLLESNEEPVVMLQIHLKKLNI